MNKRGKANLSDSGSSQSRLRNLRRNKIIISKCKKPLKSKGPQATDETKKVNGEFSNENKDKENDVTEVEDDVQPIEVSTKQNTKGKKRKLSPAREDDEVIIIEDPSTNEMKADDENVSGKEDSSLAFKGFKKRILSQTEMVRDPNSEINENIKNDSTKGSVPETENSSRKPKIVKINRFKKKKVRSGKKRAVGKDDTEQESQAEYAQYLGLQPTMQFKCYRCGEKGFPSMLALNMHQRTCGISSKGNLIANLQQDSASSSSSDPNMLTNFRITRKVYLCSACGTYYENWNLFLHMRDVHKKHICLLCLTMFGVAEKLADHLKNTHTILESTFKSSEEFQSVFKGSCYLICCSCENMFNERGDYFHHQCVKRDPTAKCNLCGVKCGHYYTCPNSNQPRTLPAVTQPTTVPKTQSLALSKHLVGGSKKKASEELWMGSKETSFHDDDYDISHAASFCHVDIDDESIEKDKKGTKENPVDISDDENQNLKSSETKLTRQQESNKKDDKSSKNKSNIVSEFESTKSKIKSALENILSKTSPEKDKNGKKTKQKKIESVEQPTNEEFNSNSLVKDIEEVIGVNQSVEPILEININLDEEKEQSENENLDPKLMKNYQPQDSSSKEQSDEHDKPQDSKSVSGKPLSSPHKNDDMGVSDADDELVTHMSDRQDDSESSSDDEKTSKKTPSEQVVDNRQDTITESDNKSGNIANEEIYNVQNIVEDVNNTSKESESRNDNSEELNSTIDDTSKVFNLEDVIGVNRPVENGEDESSEFFSKEQSEKEPEEINDGVALAGEDVPAMALTLEDKLDEVSSQSVVKECVRTSCLNCVYCSHAIKIAVNGKQLALHLLAEHRYKPVKNNETSQDVVSKLKRSLSNLESIFFNTESYDSSDKSLNTPYDYTYECFQCRYVTKIHKELYVHKRKMHQKTVLLCVMCKSNFYSYSELLCHMCPGIYASGNINFRCLFCNLDMIPSAFRLMVHLRKGHHTCDICLDVAGDQQKLSAHMWKHKLNHLCYRCGIAYRNKPDITKHLFWKHGTESVLCKKCLQKKWPHVYHFCIPPTVFMCEECNASFTKAVALKVHKRFHSGEFPYACEECDQHFVSQKLLRKHEISHNQPPPKETLFANKINTDNQTTESTEDHINVESVDEPVVGKVDGSLKENDDKLESVPELRTKKKKKRDKDRKGKAVLDVYDLPPLNLSSESDSSDEESRLTSSEITKENIDSPETKTSVSEQGISNEKEEGTTAEPADENQLPAPIVDGVWDNFHSYKAELEKRESKDLSLPNILPSTSSIEPNNQICDVLSQSEMPHKSVPVDWTPIDHNYCLVRGKPKPTQNEEDPLSESPAIETNTEVQEIPAPRGHSSSIDHAYATLNNVSGEGNNITSTEDPPSLDVPPTTSQTVTPTESQPSNKKKPKTPKKKKNDISTYDSSMGNRSSTSSDSSSDTDSSCSCVSNCSCSDSSSSSSTSSSSGSDSSTSEGRRRAAARREKKKERLKHKSHKEETTPAPKVSPPPPPEEEDEEEPIMDVPVEPVEIPVRESDLDTDVSSTDEDFYDKYPQNHTKELPIKRDLMLLASVAPVNNGTVSPPPPPPPAEPSPQTTTSKRKVKTKKRRKSQQSKKAASKSSHMRQQTQVKPSTSVNYPLSSSTPSHLTNYHNLSSKAASPLRTPATFPSDTAGSGSENDARSSKRKRVRNKFYGYSSEEESQEKPNVKWKKAETNIQPFTPPPPASIYQPSTTHKLQATVVPPTTRRPKSSESSGSDDEPRLRIKKEDSSNSSSTESETEFDSKSNVQKEQQTEKSDNLYCYCQCPYDEVSEMIACDGQDCTIEWFHFECVGIMVPPKGKWYCPDCRKRRDLM